MLLTVSDAMTGRGEENVHSEDTQIDDESRYDP